ncbi:GAF and ANTAR domain-containing protein [Alloalcanivorax gelatiniphagus]
MAGYDGGAKLTEVKQSVSEFASLARALAAAPHEEARLQIAVDAAVAMVAGCDHACVAIMPKRGPVTRVCSDDVAQQVNELQFNLNEGPCLDVRRDQDTLVSLDLSRESRWPRWASGVSNELGVSSATSLLIHTDERSYETLNLYSATRDGFDSDAISVGHTIAAHLAVVMDAERKIDQLGLAMVSRTVIGRAEGILMERLGIDEGQAFDYLRRISSHTNRKIVDIAGDIAITRSLPEIR